MVRLELLLIGSHGLQQGQDRKEEAVVHIHVAGRLFQMYAKKALGQQVPSDQIPGNTFTKHEVRSHRLPALISVCVTADSRVTGFFF